MPHERLAQHLLLPDLKIVIIVLVLSTSHDNRNRLKSRLLNMPLTLYYGTGCMIFSGA